MVSSANSDILSGLVGLEIVKPAISDFLIFVASGSMTRLKRRQNSNLLGRLLLLFGGGCLLLHL